MPQRKDDYGPQGDIHRPPREVRKRPTAAKRGNAAAAKHGARKAGSAALTLPKSRRNTGASWRACDEQNLRALIKSNTPTRAIGLKLGRSEASVRSKVQKLNPSLMPPNRSPYNRCRPPKRCLLAAPRPVIAHETSTYWQ